MSEQLPPALALTRQYTEYKIEKTMGEQLVATFLPFFDRAAPLLAEAAKMNVTDPTDVTGIKKCRALRLQIREERCNAETRRKVLKSGSLQLGNAIDFGPKLLASQCQPVEDRLEEMEKIAERMEADRITKTGTERVTALSIYGVLVDTYNIQWFGKMEADAFKTLAEGYKLAHEKKLSDAAIAEANRIAEEKRTEETRKAQARELERLRDEQYAREVEEGERRAKEAEEAARKARIIQTRRAILQPIVKSPQDVYAFNLADMTDEEFEALRLRLGEENKERERVAAALALAESQRREADKKQSEIDAAAKRAAMAPDREKLLAWAKALGETIPETSPALASKKQDAVDMLEGVIEFIEKLAKEM